MAHFGQMILGRTKNLIISVTKIFSSFLHNVFRLVLLQYNVLIKPSLALIKRIQMAHFYLSSFDFSV